MTPPTEVLHLPGDEPTPKPAFDAHLPVGTVLQIGHPEHRVAWIRYAYGWCTNGPYPRPLTRDDVFDTIGHGAYTVLLLGKD